MFGLYLDLEFVSGLDAGSDFDVDVNFDVEFVLELDLELDLDSIKQVRISIRRR